MNSTSEPTRRRLTAFGSLLALALALGACAPIATEGAAVPSDEEQPADDTVLDPVPLPPVEGAVTDTCTNPTPGSYC
jgi:hypothetical protein